MYDSRTVSVAAARWLDDIDLEMYDEEEQRVLLQAARILYPMSHSDEDYAREFVVDIYEDYEDWRDEW